MKTAAEIRREFIDFFIAKSHKFVRSAPVVPHDDPTLMFTNAGMNQFKAIFLGENPAQLTRVANSQKCMRVSGKHNDLEEVGVDHYHHTFFEMLGNWSFGDFYKKEIIGWAWELLTDVWHFPKDRLYATIYHSDTDALAFWKTETDIAHDHISAHGEDNFWEMGEVGPCGPCSELHIDLGEGICPHEHTPGHTCEVNGDNCHRYLEIWNLVFIQYERQRDGSLKELSATHVDTGMGFERVVRIIQGLGSNYDSDLFMPVIHELEKISGIKYDSGTPGIPFRVIADHMRALTFAITDGVFPSNEGRGYVLRRLLRRAYRYGRSLGFTGPFMHTLVPIVVSMMGEAYPEIIEREGFVASVIKSEEERFDATLELGIERFNQMVESTKNEGRTNISGANLFTLYDTYGFPVDLCALLAEEKGFTVDEQGFFDEMEIQKKRARAAQGNNTDGLTTDGWIELSPGAGTLFVGYNSSTADATINRYKMLSENQALVICSKTPFYAEMGGQIGDRGIMRSDLTEANVVDTITWNELSVHKIVSDTPLTPNFFTGVVHLAIDEEWRKAIKRSHSATHLLQAALIEILGDHVSQAGSRVGSGDLRFDFTHFKALSKTEIQQVENRVNYWIMENSPITTVEMELEKAKESGAKSLFGEKYGDSVRVINMGTVSNELCGGTHTEYTGNIGQMIIVAESSVSAGIRRIEARTGFIALEYQRNRTTLLDQVSANLKVTEKRILPRIEELQQKIKVLDNDLKKITNSAAKNQAEEILNAAQIKNDTTQISASLKNIGEISKESFLALIDRISDLIQNKQYDKTVVVLIAEIDDSVQIVACANSSATQSGIHCGDLVKIAAPHVGGGGGGSPIRAQAGGKKIAGIPEALSAVESYLLK